MRNTAPATRSNIIPFPQTTAVNNLLTQRDRQDVASFQKLATMAGYEELAIHRVGVGDGVGVGEYVAASRVGEAWSSWGFAREGDVVHVWSTITSANAGTFETMWAALKHALVGGVEQATTKLRQPR